MQILKSLFYQRRSVLLLTPIDECIRSIEAFRPAHFAVLPRYRITTKQHDDRTTFAVRRMSQSLEVARAKGTLIPQSDNTTLLHLFVRPSWIGLTILVCQIGFLTILLIATLAARKAVLPSLLVFGTLVAILTLGALGPKSGLTHEILDQLNAPIATRKGKL